VTLTRKTKNPIKLQKVQQKYSLAKAPTVCSALRITDKLNKSDAYRW